MKLQIIHSVSLALLTLTASEIYGAKLNAKDDIKRPNVLIIMCDQLNYKALSCYGGTVNTPNIDRLANEGVKFSTAYCTTPFCSPSRASIVTGLYLHQHGIVQNMGRLQKEGITMEDETTEKILFDKGYKTHHFGKWHLESDSLPYLPYYPDQYDFGYQYKRKMKSLGLTEKKDDGQDWMHFYGQYFPVEVSHYMKEKRTYLDSIWSHIRYKDFVIKMGRLRLKPEDWIDDRLTKLTIKRIKESASQKIPFMLTCSFILPHDPNFVPSPYYEMFDPDSLNLPIQSLEGKFENSWSRMMVKGYGEEGLREFLRIYYANVKYIDDRVGKILEALERQGVLDDTFVLFTADHGDMMGSHGMVWKSNISFYEEIAHIPFIIRYPKVVKPGVSTVPVSLVDIKPIILSVTGIEYSDEVAGYNIMPFITGEKDVSLARKYSFCERIEPHPKGKREITKDTKGAFMIRNERYKLIIYPDGDSYLYNLENDPHEIQNVIDDSKYEREVIELENALCAWLDETGWEGADVNFKYRKN
jgi:arylsulfatase A-like enzyme